MRTFIAALAAAGVLVAGAFAAAAITDDGVALAQEGTDDEAATDAPVRRDRGQLMDEVLAGLVPDVISQDQADQIKAAFEEKAAELREEFGDRGHRRGPGFRDGFRRGFDMRGLLEDGVIDADELAGLGPDHPLNDPDGPAADYVEGGLTQQELEQIHEQLREQRPYRFGPNAEGAVASA